MHIEMMDIMASADPLVQIEAFREAGKTTKIEEFLILAGAFRNFEYGLLIGETYEKACQRLNAINHECVSNEALTHLFGPVLGRKTIENKLYFKGGMMIQALGWEQELQSFKYRHYRPQFAVLDDVENLERVRDAAAVQESMDKLYQDLLPAMDQSRYKIINSQTRRAESCMVTTLAANEDWLYRGYPICNGDPFDPATVATWPQKYPMQWIREKMERYQRAGMMTAFLQAYMLQATDPAAKPFKQEMLAARDVSPHDFMPRFAIYDPSRTTNQRRTKGQDISDRTGKVIVSRMGSKIVVHESGGFYWKPDEFLDDLFVTHERHHPAKMGVEKNSLDDWIMQPIRLQMLRRGISLPIVALQAPQDRSKEDFILGLQPFAEARDIVLIGGHLAHPQLVAEWCNFPQGPRDVLNALAYSLRMFAGHPIYEDFSGANIGEAPTPKRGETVYVGFNANPAETVAVAVVRTGRRTTVAVDFSQAGSIPDAVKGIGFELRANFPLAQFQVWVPAEVHDQWQRIPLVPALREAKFSPMRAEHVAVARGCLADRLRNTWRDQRLLIVDRRALLTLNALAAGYALAAEKGGRMAQTPEEGTSRLAAEALECMMAMLDRMPVTDGLPKGANVGHTPLGQAYITSNPRMR